MTVPERERPEDEDLDRRFADAVSGWDVPAPERDRPTGQLTHSDPPGPDLPEQRRPEQRRPDIRPHERDRDEPVRVDTDSDSWRSWSPALTDPDQEWEEEGRFTPPPPEPLPGRDDRGFWAALFGLVAGPALLLWSSVIRDSAPVWMWWLGLALTVGGFAILIARRPMRREHDPDQGAQV